MAALLDLRFERRAPPILVRWVYLAALVVVGFGVLFGLLWVWSFASWMGAAIWLAAPIVIGLGLVVLLVVRIACERVLASFRVRVLPPAPVPQRSMLRLLRLVVNPRSRRWRRPAAGPTRAVSSAGTTPTARQGPVAR